MKEGLLSGISEKLDDFPLKSSDQINLVFWLLIFLLIFENSADFDGCRRSIKRKEINIIFFEIPEINLKFYKEINLEDFLSLFCLVFLLGHLLKIRKEKFQQRKRQ